jgi:hypothetical protein
MQILYFVYFLYLAREPNKPARAHNEPSRAELAFWLVKITNQADLARYSNEPEIDGARLTPTQDDDDKDTLWACDVTMHGLAWQVRSFHLILDWVLVPFDWNYKPAQKYCWLIFFKRKILFWLKKQAE